jgi:hypothetical protein
MSLLERLVAAVSFAFTSKRTPSAAAHYAPYPAAATNTLYNLLFCDEPAAFKPQGAATGPFATLFAEPPDGIALLELGADAGAEGRLRYLAFSRLRKLNWPVPPKVLLGVIVEMPLEGGLDVLAAYSEGGVRYINHTGKLTVVEGRIEPLARFVDELFAVTAPVVAQMGPWGKDKARLPPPEPGNVRLSFLVSDGLYFGQGPLTVMEQGAMGGPIIRQASLLLQAVVAMNTPQ